MSDELKIIREALAQVQNKINEQHKQNMINEYEALKGAGEWLADRKKPGDTWYKDRANEVGAYAAYSLKKPANADTADYQAAKQSDKLSYNRKTGKVIDNSSGEPTSDVFSRMRQNSQPATNSSTPKSDTSMTTTTTPKADTSSEPPKPSGSVTTNDKPVSVVKTKGGDYNVYAKGSEKAADFRKTYADAKGDFEWEGRKYAKPSSDTAPKDETPKPDDVPTPPRRPRDFNPEPEQPAAKRDFNPEPEQPAAKRDFNPEPEQRESGGKKKKMSEETNPLIAAFLKLQSENPSNMFEAAKKLSPEQKKKMDVDKDNDIDADDLSALRAGKKGKMEEDSLPTMAKPSANADTKSVTTDFSAPDRPAVSMDNKPVVSPTAPKVDTTIPSSDKKALDTKFKTIAREEVEFSQAEIDHINSFFLEASVAPNRPEVAREADSTSDKMSQNDVTGTAESGGKKKIHETSKPEVSVYDNAAHVKDKMGKVVASYSKKDHGSDYMKKANDHMSKIKEEVELDEILSASPKRKIPDWIKRKRNFNGRHDLVKARDLNYDGSKKKPNAEPKKDDVKEDTIPHKQDDVDPKFKSNILTPPKAPVKKFDKKVLSKMYEEEVELEEGRPKKNPTPETMERDPRKHIQVEAGRAAAGNVIDFHHNDGSKSKITPPMGRRIVAHLQGLKPADRQAAVNKMHDSPEGLKV